MHITTSCRWAASTSTMCRRATSTRARPRSMADRRKCNATCSPKRCWSFDHDEHERTAAACRRGHPVFGGLCARQCRCPLLRQADQPLSNLRQQSRRPAPDFPIAPVCAGECNLELPDGQHGCRDSRAGEVPARQQDDIAGARRRLNALSQSRPGGSQGFGDLPRHDDVRQRRRPGRRHEDGECRARRGAWFFETAMAWNVPIIPNNVPSRPRSGEIVVVVSRMGRYFSSWMKYPSPTSCTFRSMSSTGWLRCLRTVVRQAATGPGCCSHRAKASSNPSLAHLEITAWSRPGEAPAQSSDRADPFDDDANGRQRQNQKRIHDPPACLKKVQGAASKFALAAQQKCSSNLEAGSAEPWVEIEQRPIIKEVLDLKN